MNDMKARIDRNIAEYLKNYNAAIEKKKPEIWTLLPRLTFHSLFVSVF